MFLCFHSRFQFGAVRAFELVRDRETGNSKGYGFAVFEDPSVVDMACAGLNGVPMGDKTLTVRRATAAGQVRQVFLCVQVPCVSVFLVIQASWHVLLFYGKRKMLQSLQ